jgi:hypothetical protein
VGLDKRVRNIPKAFVLFRSHFILQDAKLGFVMLRKIFKKMLNVNWGNVKPSPARRPILQLLQFEDRIVPATYTVQNLNASGTGSLFEQITSANATADDDEIVFRSGVTGTITLASALPQIASTATAGTLTITGPGANSLTISGNNLFRIFVVNTGGNLTLNNITVTMGNITGNGGGIFNQGTLAINSCTISNSTATGNSATTGGGGGIFNQTGGTLSITNSTISSNTATGGTGFAGQGGGISNLGTITSITNSTISSNTATGGAGAAAAAASGAAGGAGGAGQGGGIFNSGTITSLTNSTLSGNIATGGRGGNGSNVNGDNALAGDDGGAGGAGGAGQGGAIFNSGTITSLTNSTLNANTTTGGMGGTGGIGGNGVIATASGDGGTGGAGGAGQGGGIFSSGTTFSLTNSTLNANTITGGTGGTGGRGGRGNTGEGRSGGTGGRGGNGGTGQGGGVFINAGTSPQIIYATISSNAVTGGALGTGGLGGPNSNNSGTGAAGFNGAVGTTSGAGINNLSTSFTLRNTIIGNNTGANDFGGTNPATSTNNLITSGTLTGANTVTSAQINLGPLVNNLGPTFTQALSSPSSAINAAANIAGTTTDQRGFTRPSATTISIGAFQYYAPPTVVSVTPNSGSPNGGTSITITGANFVAGPTTVTINGVLATNVTVVDTSTITATTPGSSTTGPVSVLVTTAGGTNIANTLFNYIGQSSTANVTTPANGAGSALPFTTQPILTFVDSFGFTDTNYNQPVTMTVSGGDGFATTVGTTTINAVAGVATFSGVGISGTAGITYTLTYTSGVITTSQTILLQPGTASEISLPNSVAGAASGSPFTTQPIVNIIDSSGNTVTSNTAPVTIAVSGGDGLATIFGTTTINAVAGVATFSGVGISGTAGTIYTLTFTSPGLISTTEDILLSFGSPTQLITSLIAKGSSGFPFIQQPVIVIQDAFGNTVADSNALVTMNASGTDGLTTTLGTTTINAVNGIATFTDAGINGTAGITQTLTFASPGLTSATQGITVTPTVTFNDSNISIEGTFPNLLISGTGFSPTAASNTVVFSGPASAGVVYSITSATSTQLTVTFTTAPTVAGILSAVVTTNGNNSGNAVQVANITTAPAISSTNPPNLAINASTINITGSGFVTTANTSTLIYNTVTFNLGAVGTVTGVTTDTNNFQTLAVSITTPPTTTGILTAIVNTSTTGAAPYLSSGAPVQVANIVVAPTVTSTPTNYLATSSPTITINGTGFDTTPGNNTVNFSTGSGTVTAATSTQLTVTFSTPPALGNLTAVVTTNGGNSGSPSGTPVQVATIIVAAPTVTSNSANLTTTTTTLTINGTNFIPVAANNTVALSLGAVGIVSSATSTQLIVSLITPPSSSGPLTAVVTIYGGNSTPLVQLATSTPVQVATVVVAPTVNTVNPPSRAINATTLTITGTGFSTTPASNTVAFNLGAFGVVTASTSTQLTVAFTTQPTTVGFLTAVVTATGVSSGAPVQVANIVAAPTVTSTTTNLGINATTLTITGTGFNANTPLSNTVTLSSGTGLVTSATATSLTLTFATQPFLSNLTAVVNSFGGNSGTPSGTPVQVATIIEPPTITASTASLAINAPTIVINGTGFSNTAASNVVTFNNGAVGTVTTATSTALTVTFSILPLALGTLSASVVSNGITSGNPFGTMVQVATIVAAPTVTFSNANIASVVTTLTILGTGFNATTPASNTVTFNNGAIGTVNSATATQLIVTYSTQPAAGALTAIVTSFGGSSGAAVQVATIIGPTISSVTPSSGTPSGGTPITIVGTNFVSGATVTIGGLAATNVVLVSSTMITAVTPPGTLGTIASVVVTTIDGTSAANSNATYAYSATPVNITITTTQTILRINQTATITFTLSASSTNFVLADVVVTGGTLSNFSGSGTLYTATYTPTVATYTTGSIYVPVNAFTDAYGTQSNPSNVVSTIINTIAPPLMASTSISGTGNAQTGIQLVNPFTGALGNVVYPFPFYNGNISITRMDYNQDGIDEVVAGAGPGGGPAIAIINSVTGVTLAAFFAFSSSFTGGVFVAAGDVNNDGFDDIIAGTGPGGGPVVTVFSGQNLSTLASFFAYESTFTGGITVASADVNGDGYCDIITGAGPGGGPLVKVFNVATSSVISQWYAYSSQFTGGVFVAAGDLNNDGNVEVVTGAGAGGGPVVGIFNSLNGAQINVYFAYPTDFMGSVRVAVGYGNNDPFLDILTGAGPGGGPVLSVWSFPSLDLISTYFVSNPSGLNGIWIA